MTTGLIKAATDIVVSLSASTVITNAIKATTPVVSSRMNKIGVTIGTIALSSLVGDAASKYVNSQIDEVSTNYREAKEEALKKNPELKNRLLKARKDLATNVENAADSVKKKAGEAKDEDQEGSDS